MKKFLALGLILTLLFIVPTTQAKGIRVDDVLYTGKRFTNSLADTVKTVGGSTFALPYNGTGFARIVGLSPDSVYLSWYATAPNDSILVDVYFGARRTNGTYTFTAVDSIKTSETDYVIIPYAQYRSRDNAQFAVVARSAGNKITGTGNKLYLRVERYFTVPG